MWLDQNKQRGPVMLPRNLGNESRKGPDACLLRGRSHFAEELLNNELSLGDFAPELKLARTAYAK